MSNQLPGNTALPSKPEEIEELINLASNIGKYKVEDFFRKPEKSVYQISPSGTHFSYKAPYERRQNIFVQPISGEASPQQLTFETERDISGYMWKGDQRIIYIKDNGGDENFSLFAVDISGENLVELTPYENIRINIIDSLHDDPDHMIIGMNKNNPQLFEPYRIHIHTGEITQLAKNENPMEAISSWMTDHNGKLRIASRVVDGVNSVLMYRATEQEEFKDILRTNFKENVSPLFFDFENEHIVYVSSNLNRDKNVITQFDLNTGKETGDIIFSHDEVDVSSMSYSRKRKVPTTVNYFTSKRQTHFLDKQREQLQQNLEAKLPGYEVVISSANRDEDKYIIRSYSDRSLGSYYFYDEATNTLKKIVEVSPWIDENDMASMTPVQYKSRDGQTINGYLSLPKNHQAGQKIPFVINPHGGPWARDYWGYNPEIQLLASQGYGVLQMNFRGSVGYGRHFWELSFKQWGATMQDDISDGVQWLIDEGHADPKRIAIYGASYGGYATLAGITFTPDLYACAIDYVGVSNLFTFMKTIPPYWEPYLIMMYEMVGHPEEDREQMTTASPALHIDKIRTPLLVVQGANDPRVNIDESDQIVEALRARNVDVPYMVKYDEGHGFGNEENQFEFYKTMCGFLQKYLK